MKIEIAAIIEKDKTFIYPEIQRNCDKRSGVYTINLTQIKCVTCIKEKKKKTTFTDEIKQFVNGLIKKDYGSDQIVGYCKKSQVDCDSIDGIYKNVWADKKQKGTFFKHLRP